MSVLRLNKQIHLGSRIIGDKKPCFIIAEAGVSHFGSLEKCFKLIDLAKNSGADAVKFQIFDIDSFISIKSKKWYSRMSEKVLTNNDFLKLQKYCLKKKILFFLTPHDFNALDFVIKMKLPLIKIGSGEVQNNLFIERIFSLNKPTIISTGMYSEDDLSKLISIIKKQKNKNIAILHCNSTYPTKLDEINLNVIDSYKQKISGVIGYSDHTEGHEICKLAVAKGAKIIEKHITLDFNIPNAQDWKVSCGPDDFKSFILGIRNVEKALGYEDKKVTKEERKSLRWARKSIILKNNVFKNSKINYSDLVIKRPGTGISPNEINNVIGSVASKDLKKETILKWPMLKKK